uniref:Phosphoinositide 3-kinase regulatory subunit 5 n=1 Tax=Gadus morhua TaxID=8049 RepID=A0A8C5A1K5_GADMO
MNRWSLEELVKRDPENFLILLQQIIRKTREVQEHCQYELVAPLAIMFSSTLLQTPFCPPDAELLEEAMQVFRRFLTWPEPYCSVCRDLLSTLQQELRAPGISFNRLVREEQGLNTPGFHSKTVTVLLMTPGEVPPEFLSVGRQLSGMQHSPRDSFITLIKHAYQSALGAKYPLASLHKALQVGRALARHAAASKQPQENYIDAEFEFELVRLSGHGSDSGAASHSLPLERSPNLLLALCPDVLNVLVENEHDLEDLHTMDCQTEEEEEEEEECVSGDDEEGDEPPEDIDFEVDAPIYPHKRSAGHRASTISTGSSLSTSSTYSTLSAASGSYAPSLSSVTSSTDSGVEDADDSPPSSSPSSSPVSEKSSPKPGKSPLSHYLLRILVRSLGNPESKNLLGTRTQRSSSLPQQVDRRSSEARPQPQPQAPALRHVCFRRRPILSSDEEAKSTTLRVVVFGADHAAGKVARAYSRLQRREGACPHLSRLFRLQFYFVPVRRDSGAPPESLRAPCPWVQAGCPPHGDPQASWSEDSTNDIAHLLGLLDPWYERNTLSLLHLPANLVCQVLLKESQLHDGSYECRLPILADLVLYYCRQATRPTLIQLYQAELTLAGGERRTEVFIHSLELGHTAGTRAVKAMGSAKKRFGIDGDREAVPLTLEVLYNKVVVSGRSNWKGETKVCTSLNLTKACKNHEDLDPKMESLLLSMTEVLKRQNCKAKKSYNQSLSTWEVKVDKVQVSGSENTTFAVCLDQDERKVLQSVVRCEVSVCSKPDSCTDWRQARVLSPQIRPLNPTFCSLLCLPVHTFVGAMP